MKCPTQFPWSLCWCRDQNSFIHDHRSEENFNRERFVTFHPSGKFFTKQWEDEKLQILLPRNLFSKQWRRISFRRSFTTMIIKILLRFISFKSKFYHLRYRFISFTPLNCFPVGCQDETHQDQKRIDKAIKKIISLKHWTMMKNVLSVSQKFSWFI